ncbi:hypothetical protein M514_21326 [Trichuris suis]|uniref:Uncharacterized protein n=1 Tax=Trichuris suis TaxID=68888 RepID=A0A085NAI6_9BILA|nr:hypothetical protein M514_21326 [Trichuris suis]
MARTYPFDPPEFTANEVGITCDRNWPKSWKQLVRKPCKLGKLPSESQATMKYAFVLRVMFNNVTEHRCLRKI